MLEFSKLSRSGWSLGNGHESKTPDIALLKPETSLLRSDHEHRLRASFALLAVTVGCYSWIQIPSICFVSPSPDPHSCPVVMFGRLQSVVFTSSYLSGADNQDPYMKHHMHLIYIPHRPLGTCSPTTLERACRYIQTNQRYLRFVSSRFLPNTSCFRLPAGFCSRVRNSPCWFVFSAFNR